MGSWKWLLLLACTASLILNVASDDGTADTGNVPETGDSDSTDATDDTDSSCAPQCGENEYWDTCISGCSNQTCDDIGKIFHCPLQPAVCRTGCRCNPGFWRNKDNKCIPECQCPPSCKKEEVYNNCTNNGCTLRSCSELGFPLKCDKKCTPGCVCRDSLLRADNGACVPRDQCPSCGGDPHATSGCGSYCVNCANRKPVVCPIGCIYNGCACKDGYIYDRNIKKCVRPTECTPTCGPNEVYNPCTNGGCDARNCSQVGKPVPCVKLDPKSCIKGCICVDGYLRASNGTCVPKDQCEISCGGDPNAKPGCGVNCGRTCSTYKKKGVVCPLICKIGGCDCKDGFVFDPFVKKCVVPSECTPTCGPNEVYNPCTNGGCDARNCSQVGKPVPCVKLDPKSCIKGCVCVDGYLRASNGTCVPKDQCGPPQCGVTEFWDTCISGCSNQTCDDIGKTFGCPAQPPYCRTGCRCKPGFWRNKNNKCIPESQCPAPPCPKGEIYNRCPNVKCDADYCPKTRDSPLTCPVGIICDPPRCVCGFSRHRDRKTGKCILTSDCPPFPCLGPNEEYQSCQPTCPGENCTDYINNSTCSGLGPGPAVPCKPQCKCKKGYFRNADGVCIKASECELTCGPNEVYSSCINGGCDARNCSQVGKPVPCPKLDPKSCIKGCVCAAGYLRASNGKCVPKDQCGPSKCDKPNEVHEVCIATCPFRRCDVDDRLVRCAAPPKPGDPDCQPGCRCADGYARNATGTCIPRCDCEKPKKCNKPNEVFDWCPAVCPPQKCGVDPALILCAPNPKYGDPACQPACICLDGYVRNATGDCIPRDQCPKCTGQNEYFDTCIKGCSNQTCDSIGKVYHCPIQTAVCRTGCRCNPGYYRNSDGVCVEQSQCPQKCGVNEYWETCISGCRNQSCDDIGKTFSCPALPPYCRTGCRCNPGFWRNKDNKCIPESQCPTPPCPDGEIYNRCPTVKCDADYCPKTRNSPLTCPVGIVCDPPRCVCGFNRHRDRKTGKCIATSDCPPFPCKGPNEEYQPCPGSCPGENCTDYINDAKCPPYRIGIVVPCRPQCKCKQGYFRNADGVCIIGCDCGPKKSADTTTSATTAPPTGNYGDNDGNTATALADLQAGVSDFTGQFLYERMQESKGENIIISAYSVFAPLCQLALNASGSSLKELLSVLNLQDKDDIRSAYPALTGSYEGQTGVEFVTASKLYTTLVNPVSDDFKKDSENIVHAEVENIDFSKPSEAADEINEWVESKTNNRIQNLVSPDMLSELTRVVLVNAIYYKGTWKYTFNKNDTQDADFFLNDGSTKKTKLMYQQGNFKYGEISDLDCKVAELPYVNQNFSMVVFLPNSYSGALDLAAKLRDSSQFNKAYSSLTTQKVKVYLPPFEIQTTTDLTDILKKVNVTKIFDPNDSGLSGILQTPEDIYISDAIQKAFIKTDETGSEAAAANAFVISTRSLPLPPPIPKVFRADRAFLYYIKSGPIPLFSGVFYS